MMAEEGADMAINFRSKGSRAEEIAHQVQASGRCALLAQADLTDQGSVERMAGAIERTFGRLDDMIEGTITPKLLERTQRGLIASRRAQAGALPSVKEFAAAIFDAAADAQRPNGHVSFVGPTD